MGTGVIAGASPLKAGWSGQPLVTMPAGLVIVPGVGILARTDTTGKQLLIDSLRGDAPETIDHFTPGLLTAKTIATWRNSRVSRYPAQASVGIVEANLGTAPGASVNGSNYLGLVLSGLGANGIAGGSVTLPLLTAHSLTDTLGDANIGQLTGFGGGATGSDIGTNGTTIRGIAMPITVSADTWVTAFWSSLTNNVSQQNMPVRGALLDANLTEIVAVTLTTPAGAAPANMKFLFPTSVLLKQNVTYYVSIAMVGASLPSFSVLSGSNPTFTGTLRFPVSGTYYQQPFSAAPGDWSQATPNSNGGGFRPVPTIFGAPSRVVLTGDLTLSLVTTGAPAPADLGNDLNARIVLAAQ